MIEYGLHNDTHIQKVHPTQAVSQTPRLKASTFKSPILDPSVADAVKRPTSLLDDLPYMHASMIHDQDELQAEKWDGSEHIDDLNINLDEEAH